MFVDIRLKEYTTGTPHERTDRLFLVRRAFRLNDALPLKTPPLRLNPNSNATRWQCRRGGWLLVDRLTGHVSQLNLPEFDPCDSTASWYRDSVAYCGVSEDPKKLYAIADQVGRRKPILKKDGGKPVGTADPDPEGPPPIWERPPMRVTFQPGHSKPDGRRGERRGRSRRIIRTSGPRKIPCGDGALPRPGPSANCVPAQTGRARLQPCRNQLTRMRALAPEGSSSSIRT